MSQQFNRTPHSFASSQEYNGYYDICDDDMSEIDNDYFFRPATPIIEKSWSRDKEYLRATSSSSSLLGSSVKYPEDENLNVPVDCVRYPPLRPRSITLYDTAEMFFDSADPAVPISEHPPPPPQPMHLDSPTGVCDFDSFSPAHAGTSSAARGFKSLSPGLEGRFVAHNSEELDDCDDDDDDCTPFQGLNLDDLEMYLDDDGYDKGSQEDDDENDPSQRWIRKSGKSILDVEEECHDAPPNLLVFLRSVTWCLSPPPVGGRGKDQQLRSEKPGPTQQKSRGGGFRAWFCSKGRIASCPAAIGRRQELVSERKEENFSNDNEGSGGINLREATPTKDTHVKTEMSASLPLGAIRYRPSAALAVHPPMDFTAYLPCDDGKAKAESFKKVLKDPDLLPQSISVPVLLQ